jgi:hypothetical protein
MQVSSLTCYFSRPFNILAVIRFSKLPLGLGMKRGKQLPERVVIIVGSYEK